MKSYGDLWNLITGEEELRAAWRRVRRNHRYSFDICTYESNLDANLFALRGDLLSGVYKPSGFRQFSILDPKPRVISCAPVRDRIVHHALCAVIAPVLEQSFVHNSFACREGKGSHRACSLARRYCRQYAYFCKMDVRHYFDTIAHDRLLEILLPKFREASVKRLIERIVRFRVPGLAAGKGLPIGNLTSQWFANAFLDEFDHLAQTGFERVKCAYLRYMDDFVFFADSKADAWALHDAAARWLADNRGLEVKGEATVVSPVGEGVPFLGLRIWPNGWRFRRERFVRMRRKFLQRVRAFEDGILDEKRFAQCAASSDGVTRWFGFKGILKDLASGKGASSGSNRVQRGGSWNNDNNNARSSNRNNNNPSNRNDNYGFRLSSTLPGYSQGPARDARAPRSAETNMQNSDRLVASANASSEIFETMQMSGQRI